MELNERNIIIDDNLNRIAEAGMENYITHAYCSEGECEVWYGGSQLHFRKGDCMIVVANRQVTRLNPSADFRVSVVYVDLDFINVCATHSNYGTRGGMSLYIDPIMHLNEEEQRLCERDFEEVLRRMRHPHRYFHGDEMVAVLQTLFIDFFEFHSRIYGEADLSGQTSAVMDRFVAMLERGDYREHRDVAWYAGELCVTPKYLSEICKRVSGQSANYWINRYAAMELSHLLKDRSLTLTDIADRFSFTSLSHFSRYVQNNLGASPSSFRE